MPNSTDGCSSVSITVMELTFKIFRQSFIGTIALWLTACGDRVSVKTDYDHSASFSRYNTYALDVAPTQLGAWGKQALEETLRSQLMARGLNETSASKADLYVVSRVSTEQKHVANPGAGRVYVPSNLGQYTGWSDIANSPDMLQYTFGTLVIDFVDRTTHQIVFRGVGKARTGIEEKNAASIQKIVIKVVAALPLNSATSKRND